MVYILTCFSGPRLNELNWDLHNVFGDMQNWEEAGMKDMKNPAQWSTTLPFHKTYISASCSLLCSSPLFLTNAVRILLLSQYRSMLRTLLFTVFESIFTSKSTGALPLPVTCTVSHNSNIQLEQPKQTRNGNDHLFFCNQETLPCYQNESPQLKLNISKA